MRRAPTRSVTHKRTCARCSGCLRRASADPDGLPALPLLQPLCGQPPRLAVYRQAYRARLVAALRSNFPVLHRALGEEAFEALAQNFLVERPSLRPSIRWFGEGLAPWLQSLPGDRAIHPALVDLARMEWALGISFDSATTEPMQAAALATTPPAGWPELNFNQHPSVQCLDLQWAVEPVWQSLTTNESAETGEPQMLEHTLLVWRQGLDSRWRSVPDDEALSCCEPASQVRPMCRAVPAERPSVTANRKGRGPGGCRPAPLAGRPACCARRLDQGQGSGMRRHPEAAKPGVCSGHRVNRGPPLGLPPWISIS